MGVEVIPANDLRWRGGDLVSVAAPSTAAIHALDSCNLPQDSYEVLFVYDGAASLQFDVQGTSLTIYGGWAGSAAATLTELITWQAPVIPGQPVSISNATSSASSGFSGCLSTLFHAVHQEPNSFAIDFSLSPLGQHDGALVFIYNATLTVPDESSTSRSSSSLTSTLADTTGTGESGTPTPRISSEPTAAHKIALYTALPLVIFVFFAGAMTALFVWRRRRRRMRSAPTLRPYGRQAGDQHSASDTDNPSAKTLHPALDKLAPRRPDVDVKPDSASPPNAVESESRSVPPHTHVDDAAALLTAVKQSGFSVATVISSLQRQVDAGGPTQANSDILPPPYAASQASSRGPAQIAESLIESNHTSATDPPA